PTSPTPLLQSLLSALWFFSKWSVKYNPTKTCALKGSTLFINGTYTNPAKFNVKEEFWVTEDFNVNENKPLYCKPTKDSGRVQCYVDKQQHFSLKLINVTKEDEHDYCFRIKTNVANEKWLGDPVKISVTELLVNTLLEVIEREAAVLTCTTKCALTDSPTFIWYKNGRLLSSNANPLHLQPVSSEDAGSYMCAVRGYEHIPSPAQHLCVRYSPKNVSVSISPSGEIVEGSSVTLTCSSDANPPVQNYTWFKEGGTSPVGSGQTYSIISIMAEHTGLYYCVAQNEHGALNGTVTIKHNSVRVCLQFGLYLPSPPMYLTQDDVQYSTVTPSRCRPVQDDVQYATVRVQCDGVISTDQLEEPQYASVIFHHHTSATG
uniref:Ig-like domain-containing protein n=1 Tax=Electrophorus electricus TaxID=8005 RepID=A0A4W4E2C1_ELEEL